MPKIEIYNDKQINYSKDYNDLWYKDKFYINSFIKYVYIYYYHTLLEYSSKTIKVLIISEFLNNL